MVRIVDGDIVPDDDPRVQQRPADASRVQLRPATTSLFDWNAPIVRTCPPGRGEATWFGLPDVQIYGCRVRTPHVLATALATYVWSWRGLVLSLVVLYAHLLHRHASTAATSTSPGYARAVRDYWTRPPPGRATTSRARAPSVGASEPRMSGTSEASTRAFSGRARRLDE